MSIKEYLYTTGDKIQLWSANLSAKMEAVRQNQDEILKFKKTFEDLVKESGDVTKSIQKAADNIGEYDIGQIRDISDIGGIKKLATDLKETRSVANKSIADLKKHIKIVKKSGKSLEDTTTDIDESEKAISELMQAEADAAKVQAKAEEHLNENLLEEKDQVANKAKKASPEDTTADCPLKDCTIDFFTVEDGSGRKIAFDNNPSVEGEAPAKNKSDTNNNDIDGEKEEKKDPPPPTTLYVICGEKDGYTEEITIKSKGGCKNGAACPAVSLKGGSIDESAAVNLTKIKLKSEKIIPEKSWASFIREIIVPDMKVLSTPIIYDVNVHDCDSKDDISDLKIISFPPAGWAGNAQIEYKEKNKSEKKVIRDLNTDTDFDETSPMGEWKVDGEISCYLDKTPWKFKPSNEFFNVVQECMNKITPLFNEIDNDYVDIKIGWPNLKLSGNVDLAEVPNHNKLSYDGKINLIAKPFLSLKIDVDIREIIERILESTSPFGAFINEIMKVARKGIGNESAGAKAKIEVKLETEAEINGDLEWTRKASEGSWSSNKEKSSFGGSMGVTVYGSVEIEGHSFFVKASAGASIHAKSNDGKEMSKFSMTWAAIEGMENPALMRQMSFNGLAIYYSAYVEGGVSKTTTEKAKTTASPAAKARNSLIGATINSIAAKKKTSKGTKELKKLCKLMKEWKSIDESTEIGKDTI